MGYHDQLIDRLRDSGEWADMTTDRRHFFESIDDYTAGVIMALSDDKNAEAAFVHETLPSPVSTAQTLTFDLTKIGAINLLEVFRGKLFYVDSDKRPKLTALGKSLFQFLQASREAGFNLSDTLRWLRELTPMAALMINKFGEREG